MSVRDKIRAASVGAKKNFRSELVTWGEGEDAIEVEIRQPSVKERRQLMRAVTDETGEIDGQDNLGGYQPDVCSRYQRKGLRRIGLRFACFVTNWQLR